MIESKKFKQIESEFSEFCNDIKQKNKYQQEIFYLFEQALENIKGGHFEIAMFILCVITESISSKRSYDKYKTFDKWLCEDKGKFLNFSVRIDTKLGGHSDPESLSSQDIAKMVLDVMKNSVTGLS